MKKTNRKFENNLYNDVHQNYQMSKDYSGKAAFIVILVLLSFAALMQQLGF